MAGRATGLPPAASQRRGRYYPTKQQKEILKRLFDFNYEVVIVRSPYAFAYLFDGEDSIDSMAPSQVATLHAHGFLDIKETFRANIMVYELSSAGMKFVAENLKQV